MKSAPTNLASGTGDAHLLTADQMAAKLNLTGRCVLNWFCTETLIHVLQTRTPDPCPPRRPDRAGPGFISNRGQSLAVVAPSVMDRFLPRRMLDSGRGDHGSDKIWVPKGPLIKSRHEVPGLAGKEGPAS